MGSPLDEPEREKNETQHTVTLTTGYWLADTACTQALWRAVLGKNPAEFNQNLEHPVERVSWDDVQVFLGRLNELVNGNLDASLPTEAQWEYACRAGTTTAFSFGENLTTDQANYDGNYPYTDGKKGEYRKQTLPVYALPANPWGLHQMHGNVWEWCQDGYTDYPVVPVVDPIGLWASQYHMMRGGSWINNARRLRSPYRGKFKPDFPYFNVGFRLSAS